MLRTEFDTKATAFAPLLNDADGAAGNLDAFAI
jgi:hypothetical protein